LNGRDKGFSVTNKTLEYRLSFATPAFLGNAQQQAQWRTPPIKALIRQWWRVVKAPQVRFNIAELRNEEGSLFGTASDEGKEQSHCSHLRLRLSGWDDGKLTTWPVGEPKINHPEKGQVGSDLYLGYGPLVFVKGAGTVLGVSKSSGQKRTAIDDKAQAELRLMFPDAYAPELIATLQLIAWFGTLGSRSRNGWGALQMLHEQLKSLTRSNLEEFQVTRSLTDCLQEDWPHAIGKDGAGPLVWKTRVTGDWRQVMKELARIKIAFRTQFKFESGGDGARIERRHVLAYPVTNHNPRPWVNQERLANQLRFKVARTTDGELEGVIVHLPCKVPDELLRKLDIRDQKFLRTSELAVWQAVHVVLDNNANRLA
jgi:CRISPR-associated protein Cmr1